MSELSLNDKMTLVQYSIEKYENEEELLSKLSSVLPEKRYSKKFGYTNWNLKKSDV